MKVILLEDVKSLGKKGEIVTVSDGYARNMILPKKLGVEATSANMNTLKLQKANEDKIAAQKLADAKELAKDIEQKEVVVSIKTGEGGRSFGSVSTKEVAEACKKQFGLELDKKKFVLDVPIKAPGYYDVVVKLHPQVQGKLRVKVEESK